MASLGGPEGSGTKGKAETSESIAPCGSVTTKRTKKSTQVLALKELTSSWGREKIYQSATSSDGDKVCCF